MSDYMELIRSKEHHQELVLNAQQERMAKQFQRDLNGNNRNLGLGLLQNILRRLKHGLRSQKRALFSKPSAGV